MIGQRAKQGGAPQEGVMDFDGEDSSWEREWREFVSAVREERTPRGDGQDGLAALRLVEAAYASARERRAVTLSAKEDYAEPKVHRAVS